MYKKLVKKIKNTNNGITLIALIITIIVLLILVGVSIAMLTGENGILQQTKNAKERTGKEEVIENAKIDVLEQQVENKSDKLEKSQLESILNKYFLNVPDMSDMDRTEILNTKLNTLANYGTYIIEVSEIFNGDFNTQVNTKSFFISGTEYQFVEGWTFERWINSEYNVDSYKIVEWQYPSGMIGGDVTNVYGVVTDSSGHRDFSYRYN